MTTTTTTTSIGVECRFRREQLGLTRHQLAALAGVSLTTVANIEAGIVPKRGYALPRIQNALHAAQDAFTGEDS